MTTMRDLELKLLRGGSAAMSSRFAGARSAVDALPKRRQIGGLSRRLKRAEKYLAKRGKRDAVKNTRPRRQAANPAMSDSASRLRGARKYSEAMAVIDEMAASRSMARRHLRDIVTEANGVAPGRSDSKAKLIAYLRMHVRATRLDKGYTPGVIPRTRR